MTTYYVSSTAAALNALGMAKDGDVISLAGGTYAGFNISNYQSSGNVTFTSTDPANPAVLNDLKVMNSSGLTFSGLDMTATESSSLYCFLVGGSTNITFDHVSVSGPHNLGTGLEKNAFLIRSSNGITISNSEFSYMEHGINLLDNNNVTITGNSFHDLRTDGIRGGGNNYLTISQNLFTDFYPLAGDHPDAIQLWTTNTTTSAHDITITDNLIVRGDGQPMQGIFVTDQTGGAVPYKNVLISGNQLVGTMYNGIMIAGVDGGAIINNNVMGLTDMQSWIRTSADANLKVSGNVSTAYVLDGASDPRLAENTLQSVSADLGQQVVTDWLEAHISFASLFGGINSVLTFLDYATVVQAPPTDSSQTTTDVTSPATDSGQTTDSPPVDDSPVVQQPVEQEPSYILVSGTSRADKLHVSADGDTRIEAGDGNDTLYGGGDHSQLVGGRGDDYYYIKSAGDEIIENAGEGLDTAIISVDHTLEANVENLWFGKGTDSLTGVGNDLDNRMIGNNGTDRMYGMGGNDLLQGGSGNDFMDGGDGNDDLRGEDGNDTIFGGAGNDTIAGMKGNDVINGGAGNDLIEGGAGADVMTGGAGTDTFRFRPGDLGGSVRDTITDFTHGEDRIVLSLLDARTNQKGDQAFQFIGNSGFHKVAGELNYQVSGNDAIVSGDTNGDGVADFSLVLKNVSVLYASDFLL